MYDEGMLPLDKAASAQSVQVTCRTLWACILMMGHADRCRSTASQPCWVRSQGAKPLTLGTSSTQNQVVQIREQNIADNNSRPGSPSSCTLEGHT